jgi:hypothetical protein
MKRALIIQVLFVSVFAFTSTAEAKPKPTPCPGVFEISDCNEEGCGDGIDTELNKRKNIRSKDGETTLRSIKWMQKLKDPTPKGEFCADEVRDRTKLEELGESQKITVVAWALAARSGSQESCNCKLKASPDTDNHIVLVEPTLKDPTLDANEAHDSETAEFTPRTRLDHPNFTQEVLESLIDPDWSPGETATEGKLLVRVTGLLMFDSEHYCGLPLQKGRRNNWEIHPVLKMEYCPEEKICNEDSDENWVDLDKE